MRRLCGRLKENGQVTYYVLFCPLCRVITGTNCKSYYVLGVRVLSRAQRHTIYLTNIRQQLDDIQTALNLELPPVRWELRELRELIVQHSANIRHPVTGDFVRLRLEMLENRILNGRILRKISHGEQDYTLLFDCLYNKKVEAIDAFSLFLYMQEQNMPSKYVLMEGNAKAAELCKHPDVICVSDEADFIFNHPDLLAGARRVLTSFGLNSPFDCFLKRLPFLDYIFIEHGVYFFKEIVGDIYGPTCFDRVLAPTKKSHEMYLRKGIWPQEKMLLCGIPRWDMLERKAHAGNNIFIFFTWRRTFFENPGYGRTYFGRICSLLANPDFRRIVHERQLTVNLALHHGLAFCNIPIPDFDENINIIDMNRLSNIIGVSDLLITDYSGLSFDFMYLDIPVIFYRCDFDSPGLTEQEQLDFRSIRDKDSLVYNCVYAEIDAIKLLEHYAENGFVLEEENLRKNKAFFWEKQDIRKHICEQLKRTCGDR